MFSIKGFCDLNVRDGEPKNALNQTCFNLMKHGYKIIALNQVLIPNAKEIKKKNNKKSQIGFQIETAHDPVPPPLVINQSAFQGKLAIIHRLTIETSSVDELNLLSKSINLSKYNLIAVIPKSPAVLQYICGPSSFDVDIISFDPLVNNPIFFKRPLYSQAIEKDMFFEISYAPAIMDSTCRKNTITTAHIYHALGKSKNVFVSSNASQSIHIRGPYDVINLGLIFGLSEEQAKNALTTVCRNLCIRGEARRHGKVLMLVKQVMSASEEEESMDEDEENVEQSPKRQKLE